MNTIKMLSLNFEYGLRWQAIVELIKKHQPDIVAGTEVDAGVRRTGYLDIAAKISDELRMSSIWNAEFCELLRGNGHPAYTGQALFTTGRIIHSKALSFEYQPASWSPWTWHGLRSLRGVFQPRKGGRIYQVASLQLSGWELLVVNTHLECRVKDWQLAQQMSEVWAFIGQPEMRHFPVVVVGDFNTQAGGNSLVLKQAESAGFEVYPKNGTPTTLKGEQLDWLCVRNARVVSGLVDQTSNASDHFPLVYSIQPLDKPQKDPRTHQSLRIFHLHQINLPINSQPVPRSR